MPKVVIAEDNILLGDLLEDYLISEGLNVCGVAGTVDQAVDLINLHKPDVAVLDLRLSNRELGSDIYKRINDQSSLAVLYVSGDPLKNRLTEADGVAYIQKPYGMHDLSRAIKIVNDIKNNIETCPDSFPNGFHLLHTPDCKHRKSA